MPKQHKSTEDRRQSGQWFHTTAWSRVLRAATPDDPAAQPALAELCRAYWYPLYAFLRRRGKQPSEAEDDVQSFFAWLLEKNIIRYADPHRGRFRGFLVAAMQQFLARQHEYASAQKRSPPGSMISIEAGVGEARYVRELTEQVTPEQLYDYAWAVSLLKNTMDRLRAEYEADGKAARFEAFEGSLTGQSKRTAREIGESLGLSEGAVRVAVHRLKQRYGELLRKEVGSTLDDGEEIEGELRNLLAALKCGRSA